MPFTVYSRVVPVSARAASAQTHASDRFEYLHHYDHVRSKKCNIFMLLILGCRWRDGIGARSVGDDVGVSERGIPGMCRCSVLFPTDARSFSPGWCLVRSKRAPNMCMSSSLVICWLEARERNATEVLAGRIIGTHKDHKQCELRAFAGRASPHRRPVKGQRERERGGGRWRKGRNRNVYPDPGVINNGIPTSFFSLLSLSRVVRV